MRRRSSFLGFLVISLLTRPDGLGAQERVIPLDTVRVSISSRASAEMATATRGVEVITAEEIRRLPARSVPELLQWALGVDVMPRSPALADVALRGSSFEQVLVMVDGVRVSDAQTGHFDLNLAVPLDQVERVEILRGPASTLHGADAVGGVINLVTRQGGSSRVRVESGSFGTAGTALAHTLSFGGVRADLAADLRRSDGHREGTDYRTGLGRAALSAPLGGRTLRADLGWAARNFGADGFYGPYPSYEETRTTTATLSWRDAGEGRLSVDPVLSFRRNGDEFILRRADPDFYRNQHTTDQLGGELTARYSLAPGLALAAGAEAFVDRLESSTLGDRSERRGAVVAEVAAGRRGALTGTAGVRADWHEVQGLFWSPAVAGAWWPAAGLRVRASAGGALRTPTWTERYYRDPANQGDPGLRPERAWSGEVGADAHPVPGARLGAAVFVRQARDLIDWAKPEGAPQEPWTTRNVESARFRGLEAEVGLEEVLGVRWTARGMWLSVSSSEAPGFTSKYALRPLVETLSLAAERGLGSRAALALRAQRARRIGEAAYLRVDGRASYDFGRVRLHVDLQNLADAEYPDITGAVAPGRALFVGAEWHGR